MIASAAEIRAVLGLFSSITDIELAVLQMAHRRAESTVARVLRYNPERATRVGELYPIGCGRDTGGAVRYTSDGVSAIPLRSSRNGSDQIIVKHIPIRSVISIHVDESARSGTFSGAFADSTLLEEGVGFHPDYDADGICRSGMITRIGSGWPAESGTIKMSYNSGYSAEELNGDYSNAGFVDALPIKTAVIATAAKAFIQLMSLQKKARVGFTAAPLSGEKLGDYSYSTNGSLNAIFSGLLVDIPAEAYNELSSFIHFGFV